MVYPGYRLRRAAHGLPALYLPCAGWLGTDGQRTGGSFGLPARPCRKRRAGGQPAAAGGRSVPDPQHPGCLLRPGCAANTQGPIQELAALLPAESYAEQLAAYQQLCTSALENYETLLPRLFLRRAGHHTPLWQEQVVFSVRLYLYALRGAVRFCTAREQFLDKDWQNCFCTLGRAADDFGAMAALLQPKTGFWAGFCSDTMLDGALTARVLTGLMAISPRGRGRAGLCRLAGSTAWCPGSPRAGFYPVPRPGAGGNEKSVRAGPKMHRKIHVLPELFEHRDNPRLYRLYSWHVCLRHRHRQHQPCRFPRVRLPAGAKQVALKYDNQKQLPPPRGCFWFIKSHFAVKLKRFIKMNTTFLLYSTRKTVAIRARLQSCTQNPKKRLIFAKHGCSIKP